MGLEEKCNLCMLYCEEVVELLRTQLTALAGRVSLPRSCITAMYHCWSLQCITATVSLPRSCITAMYHCWSSDTPDVWLLPQCPRQGESVAVIVQQTFLLTIIFILPHQAKLFSADNWRILLNSRSIHSCILALHNFKKAASNIQMTSRAQWPRPRKPWSLSPTNFGDTSSHAC